MAFPTTRWNILDNLRMSDADRRARALGEITTLYGPALFAFARYESKGALSREDCEDVVGDFFLKCVEQDVLQRADRLRGRFRNFLAKTFKNFMRNWIRDRAAGIRAPAGGVVSLHELIDRHGQALEPRAGEAADDTLVRVLRVSLFDSTLREFESACYESGQQKKYRLYVQREISPPRDGTAVPGYAALAVEFALPSEDAVGRVIRAARDEFHAMLLERIGRDCESSAEADLEFKLVVATALGS